MAVTTRAGLQAAIEAALSAVDGLTLAAFHFDRWEQNPAGSDAHGLFAVRLDASQYPRATSRQARGAKAPTTVRARVRLQWQVREDASASDEATGRALLVAARQAVCAALDEVATAVYLVSEDDGLAAGNALGMGMLEFDLHYISQL